MRDLRANTTRLVSPVAPSNREDGEPYQPAVSDDGHLVAFVSQVRPRYAESGFGYSRVLLHDVRTNALGLVSRADGVNDARDGLDPMFPGSSGDGRFIGFDSRSTNFGPDDTDTLSDVYVRDVAAATTTLVSRATGDPRATAVRRVRAAHHGVRRHPGRRRLRRDALGGRRLRARGPTTCRAGRATIASMPSTARGGHRRAATSRRAGRASTTSRSSTGWIASRATVSAFAAGADRIAPRRSGLTPAERRLR